MRHYNHCIILLHCGQDAEINQDCTHLTGILYNLWSLSKEPTGYHEKLITRKSDKAR